MARLRKLNADEPSIFTTWEDAETPRSSPRKTTRRLRYTSSNDEENSVLVPKSSRLNLRQSQTIGDSPFGSRPMTPNDTLTPRKQRVLRPVESNSRLLRKISNETLASPEKRQRERRIRSGTTDTDIGKRGNLMYAKSLAKSVMKKQTNQSRIDVVGENQLYEASVADTQQETFTDADLQEEIPHSIWQDQGVIPSCESEMADGPISKNDDTEDEDEDPVVSYRHRHRRQNRRAVSESDEDETELPVEERLFSREPSFKIPALPAHLSPRKSNNTISNWAQDVVDQAGLPEHANAFIDSPPARMRSASFASRQASSPVAILTYSPTPTKCRSPRKEPPVSRSSTPPLCLASPTKLVSPSKKKHVATKTTELRQSLDAFWMPDVHHDADDTQMKPLVSPRKQKWREDVVKIMEGVNLEDSSDEDYRSPTTNTKKNSASIDLTQEPTVKEIRAQRKEFEARKHALADAFVVELDTTICAGRVGELSQSTGGVKLIWSKTLKTTAGRANWRKEQIRVRTGPEPTDIRVEIRHQCSIELAEKVIDDEERLYNVLAHEFCHLTTFMISEVRNNPHGAEFKSWGRKATSAFKEKGVEVTTKHSYQIEYKYVWECLACGYEFKRHSKSIDTNRHSCGKCKGRLAQTKPKPRGAAAPGAKKEKTEYQLYVKANFARVKKELEAQGADTQMGKVMAAVAKGYRENKEKVAVEVKKEVIDLEAALEDLKL